MLLHIFRSAVLTGALLSGALTGHAQYTVQWVRQIGSNPSSNNYAFGEDIAITPQGKIAVNGMTDTGGHLSAVLKSYDTSGNQLWARTFGGVVDAEAFRLFPTPSGQWLTAGQFEDASGTHDIFWNTYTQAGDSVSGGWQHTPGFASSDELEDAVIDSHGNVYLGGTGVYPYAQGTLTRFDTGGVFRWTAPIAYFTGSSNQVKGVAMAGDARIVSALANTTGYSTLTCHDSAGVLLWRRDSLVYAPEFHTALATDAAGNAITGGRYTGGYRVVKLNTATGDTLWTRNLAHPGVTGQYGTIHHVLTDAASNIYAFGYDNAHALLATLSPAGQVLWTDTLAGNFGPGLTRNGEQVLLQDGMITIAAVGFNPRILQYDLAGNKLSDSAFGLPGLYYPEISGMEYYNGDLYVTGNSTVSPTGGGGARQGFVARLKMKAQSATGAGALLTKNQPQLYPNPATSEIFVEGATGKTVTIMDAAGRICSSQKAVGNRVDVRLLPAGSYVVLVADAAGKQTASGQFVKR